MSLSPGDNKPLVDTWKHRKLAHFLVAGCIVSNDKPISGLESGGFKARRRPQPTREEGLRAKLMEVAATLPTDRRKVTRLKPAQRSRVTNGSGGALPNVDGRSAAARRFKDIANALADQYGECSESRLQLIRRFAAASVLAEQLESRLANGEQINVQEHALLCSSLVRLANKLGGLDRVAKTIVPSVADYVASLNAQEAE